MAEKKRSSAPKIEDVAHPGKSAPSMTSKPVLVTNRPILKDPMMVDEETSKAESTEPGKENNIAASGRTIQTIDSSLKEETVQEIEKEPEPSDQEQPAKPEPEVEATKDDDEPAPTKPAAPEKSDDIPQEVAEDTKPPAEEKPTEETADDSVPKRDPSAAAAKELEEAAAKQTEHETAMQKLVDDKRYFLPINAVEKRRTNRVIALGIFFSLLLVLAWVDIALDAGLIQLGDLKAVTHFFST